MNQQKKYPSGTTKAQWDQYEQEKREHDEYYARIKPKPEDFPAPEFYKVAFDQWSFDEAMSAPNKPGYFRANND